MNNRELDKYATLLKTKQADIIATMWNRDGIAIETVPEMLDQAQFAADRELALDKLTRERDVLRNVTAALDRISDGSYGICVQCEEPISHKRLNAIPWTALCLACQEAADCVETGKAQRLIANSRQLRPFLET